MNTKLQKHIMDIIRSDGKAYRGCFDKYCLASSYRFIHFDEDILGPEIEPMLPDMEKAIKEQFSYDYTRRQLEPVAELKKKFPKSRKKTPDICTDLIGSFTLNARYLIDAMTALEATVCYTAGPRNPVMLFYKDDCTSPIYEMIMQCYKFE